MAPHHKLIAEKNTATVLRIFCEEYKKNGIPPSYRALVKLCKLSNGTIQNAMARLRASGKIKQVPGTRVCIPA